MIEQDWSVTVTTVDGQTHEGKINRIGLMHHMLTDDGSGWLVVDAEDGQHALHTSKVVSIVIADIKPQDIDAAIEAYQGARR